MRLRTVAVQRQRIREGLTRVDAEVTGIKEVVNKLLSAQMPVLSWWAICAVLTRASTTLTGCGTQPPISRICKPAISRCCPVRRRNPAPRMPSAASGSISFRLPVSANSFMAVSCYGAVASTLTDSALTFGVGRWVSIACTAYT